MLRFLRYLYSYFNEIIIEKSHSKFNPCLEVSYVNGKLVLNTRNSNYSFGSLHRVFQKVFKKINIQDHEIKDVLILGFGAGSVASILLEEYNIDCKITGVEIDPRIIKIANDHFALAKHPLVRIIKQDAVDFISENNDKYDLVVVDVYIDNDVPEDCETDSFIKNLGKIMSNNSILVFNKLVYDENVERSAYDLHEKFESLLGKTEIYKIRDRWLNRIFVYQKIQK